MFPEQRIIVRHSSPFSALTLGVFTVLISLLAYTILSETSNSPAVVGSAHADELASRIADANGISRNASREVFTNNQTRKKNSAKSSDIVKHLVDIRTTRTALQDLKDAREAERQAQRQAEREAAAAEAAEEAQEEQSTSTQQTQTTSSSGGLPALLLTIRANESGGNYSAYNPSGCEGYGCGGAYQLHARYAATWAASAGYPGLSGAAQTWDPETQDAVALWLFYSTNPDGMHWCQWTDYC